MSHEDQPIFRFWRRAAQLERIEMRLLQVANQIERLQDAFNERSTGISKEDQRSLAAIERRTERLARMALILDARTQG